MSNICKLCDSACGRDQTYAVFVKAITEALAYHCDIQEAAKTDSQAQKHWDATLKALCKYDMALFFCKRRQGMLQDQYRAQAKLDRETWRRKQDARLKQTPTQERKTDLIGN